VYRLLKEMSGYLRDLSHSAVNAWCEFFFAAADPTPLGVMRVAVGVLLLWDVAVLGLDLREYLGSDGWMGPAAARAYLANNSPWAWSFWFWVPDRWLWAAWGGCLLVLALFTLGLWSRVTSVLAWAIAISIVRRAPAALFGFDQMISTWAFYLAVFGASGQAVSFDRFFARCHAIRRNRADLGQRGVDLLRGECGRPPASVSANLSLRMLQLHLVMIYGSAGLSKLMGPEWWNGSAMEMVILTPEFRRFDFTWLFRYPTGLALATHFGLLLEIVYPVLIWFRRLRPLVIASVLFLHVGIDLILGLTEFGLTMIVANIAFASGPWLRGLITGLQQPVADLYFPPRSPRACALGVLALAADPDRLLQVIDASSATAPVPFPDHSLGHPSEPFVLSRSDGRKEYGFNAVLTLSRWLPLYWPIGMLGMIPGLRLIVRAVYGALFADAPRERTKAPTCPGRISSASNSPGDAVTLSSAR
jgi:hypothetical protein